MVGRLRIATLNDVAAMEQLIELSARHLSVGFYNKQETEAAISYVFGVDSELLEDQSYFVIEEDSQIIACGGWSRRTTLFGGDQYANRASGYLNPTSDAAKIRAFFVHPDHARKGAASQLLEECEAQATSYGFSLMEMMSTLPGIPFYQRKGYAPAKAAEEFTMPNGVNLLFQLLQKDLRVA